MLIGSSYTPLHYMHCISSSSFSFPHIWYCPRTISKKLDHMRASYWTLCILYVPTFVHETTPNRKTKVWHSLVVVSLHVAFVNLIPMLELPFITHQISHDSSIPGDTLWVGIMLEHLAIMCSKLPHLGYMFARLLTT